MWAHDEEVCRRAPDLDDDLTAQQREAGRDLEAAVERSDLDGALDAYRRGTAARFAQREVRDAWRSSWAQVHLGAKPPEPSMRQVDTDDMLTFTAALDRAANRSAYLASELVVGGLLPERPTAPPEALLPSPATLLRHTEGCPSNGARTEVSQSPVGYRSHGTVVRCLDCTAQHTLVQPPEEPEQVRARKVGNTWPSAGKAGAPGSMS